MTSNTDKYIVIFQMCFVF